jgi:hypothetical protein
MIQLQIRQRRVPAGATATYRAAWESLVDRATAVGARAWIFRGTEDPTCYTEFVEYGAGQHVALISAISAADRLLEQIAAATTAGTWEEWTRE